MARKRHVLLGLLAGAFVGGIVWLAISPDEPVYQGKSLTAWLQQCSANTPIFYQNPPPNYQLETARRDRLRTESEIAIRRIGTNALPCLLKMVAAKDSPLKRRLMALWDKQSLVSNPFRSAAEVHWMAESGFASLRSIATPAVPGLIRLLYVPSTELTASIPGDASSCLSYIGETAVPDLLPLLTNRNQDVKSYAASALSVIVQRLIHLVGTDENETNRWQYAIEMAAIGSTDPDVTKALTDALKDKSLLVRTAATNALMKINPDLHYQDGKP